MLEPYVLKGTRTVLGRVRRRNPPILSDHSAESNSPSGTIAVNVNADSIL